MAEEMQKPSWLKTWTLGAVAVLVLFALGYGAGRFTAPVKVVEKTKLVERLVTDTSQQTKAQTNDKKDEQTQVAKKQRRHVERTFKEIVHPDGTKEITANTTVDTGNSEVEKKNDHEEKQVQVQQVTKQHQDLDLHLEQSKETTYARANWRVSALVGLDVGALKLDPLTVNSPLVYGAEIERRIIWNAWGGAWALRLPDAFVLGAKASLEF